MARVYVSSTYADLQEVREQVRLALRSLGHEDVAMEYYVAGHERPLKKCLEDVEKCDIYLGIFAWRYGFIPPGETRSITELEYRQARATGKDCLAFLLDEKAYWPMDKMEIGAYSRIESLRKQLAEEHVVSYFKSKDDIRGLVAEAIFKWEKKPKVVDGQGTTDALSKYLEYLVTINRYVSTRGITQMTGPAPLKIEDVYVPLSAEPIMMHGELTDLDNEITRRTILGGMIDAEGDSAFGDYEPAHYVMPRNTAQVLRENRQVLILGDPGSGKTMLVRFLTLQFALAAQRAGRDELFSATSGDGQSNGLMVVDNYGYEYGQVRLPIMLRVAEFADAYSKNRSTSLREFLPSAYGVIDVSREAITTLFRQALAAGNALVLLDGLDEIIDVVDRSLIARRIEEFVAGIHHNNQVLVTSRTAGYRSVPLGAEFAHFKLRDMDRAQINRFLQSLYSVKGRTPDPSNAKAGISSKAGAEVETLLRAVDKNAGVQRLAGNPLMLTILSLTHRTGARLPNQRGELYKIATRTLLQDWQLARGIPTNNTVKESEAQRLLGPLAYWMHSNKPSGLVREQEARERLASWLVITRKVELDDEDVQDAVDDFLKRVREHTGIFVERAPGHYGFMHLTFEEYFAATELVKKPDDFTSFVYSRKSDPRWEEPIMLAMGFLSNKLPDRAEDCIRTSVLAEGGKAREMGFRQSLFEDLLHRDKIFAAMCIGDCPGISKSLLQQVLRELIIIYLDAKGACRFEPLRERIAACLGSFSSNEAVEEAEHILLEAMADKRASVRGRALLAAAKLKVTSHKVIARSIAATSDNNREVRRNAVIALMESKALPAAEDALLGALKDKNIGVRVQAIYALADLKLTTPRAVEALLGAFGDTSNEVRRRAIWATGELDLQRPEVYEVLNAAVKDKNRAVQIEAVRTLVALKQVKADLIRALQDLAASGDTSSRSNAIWALVEMRNVSPELVGNLLSFLKDSNPYIRSTTARALVRAELSIPELLDALLDALTDEDSNVRSSVIWTLGSLKVARQEVVSALTARIKDGGEAIVVRKQAIRTLVKARATTTIVRKTFIEALKDDDPEMRRFAAWALGELTFATSNLVRSELVESLSRSLDDENKAVAAQVAYALVKLRSVTPEVTQKILSALNDEDKNLRVLSARALTEICTNGSCLDEVEMKRILTELRKELLEQRNNSDVFSGRYYLHVYDVMWEALWVAAAAFKAVDTADSPSA